MDEIILLTFTEELAITGKAVKLKINGFGETWVPLEQITHRQGDRIAVKRWWYDQVVDNLIERLEAGTPAPKS